MLPKWNPHVKTKLLCSFSTYYPGVHSDVHTQTQRAMGSWQYYVVSWWQVGHWNELSLAPAISDTFSSCTRAKLCMDLHVWRHHGMRWWAWRVTHHSHTTRSRARFAAGSFPSHCLHQLKIIILNPNRKWFAHTTTASMQGRAFLLARSSTTRFKIKIEEKIWCITSGANICVKRKQTMIQVHCKVYLCKCGHSHSCSFFSCVLSQVLYSASTVGSILLQDGFWDRYNGVRLVSNCLQSNQDLITKK